MKYRKKLSRGQSRRNFSRGTRVKRKNAQTGYNMRGGIRL
jgi:hypothetical protein